MPQLQQGRGTRQDLQTIAERAEATRAGQPIMDVYCAWAGDGASSTNLGASVARLFVIPYVPDPIKVKAARVNVETSNAGAYLDIALYFKTARGCQIVPGSVAHFDGESTGNQTYVYKNEFTLLPRVLYFMAVMSNDGTARYLGGLTGVWLGEQHSITYNSSHDFPRTVSLGENTKDNSLDGVPMVLFMSNAGRRLL